MSKAKIFVFFNQILPGVKYPLVVNPEWELERLGLFIFITQLNKT